jgi:hypothetical protein
MAKSSKKSAPGTAEVDFFEPDDELLSLDSLDNFFNSDQPDFWDVTDEADQSFWDEFFHLEDLLNVTDELDPPSFTITVQNHQTGEVKTYSNITLKSGKKKIVC